MSRISAEAVAKSVRELPALPAVITELIRSLVDPDVNVDHLARQIAQDQAITAKTLRLANSSFFGLPRQVQSVADATAVLGLRSVRNIAMAAGVGRSFAGAQRSALDFAAFWRHALGCALAAEALAERTDQDPGLAFTAGLLHDVGRLVLASGFAPQYREVQACQFERDCPVQEAECAVLGFDHGEVGALLAEQWNFSSALVDAIALHHRCNDAPRTPLADLIHLADNIAHALDLAGDEHELVPPLSMQSWTRLGLAESMLYPVFDTVEQRHSALCQALLQ